MKETKRTRHEALRQPVFRRLYLGALKIKNPKHRLIACYVILLAGRLGLRHSEIQHVRSAWIDWERGVIAIPEFDPCGCRRCWISAKQMKERAEETDEPSSRQQVFRNMTIPEIIYAHEWDPKTERGARQIPFGYSPRLTAVIMTFQSRYKCLDLVQEQIRNIIYKAATHAEGVDESKVTVRGLRGTGATFFSTLVYRPKVLQDLLGWTRIETARKYLRRASGHIAHLMYQIFGAEELAPPIFPEEPEEDYPLVASAEPYTGEFWDPREYGLAERKERAEVLADEPLHLYHPREANPFDEFEYDPEEHDIDGAIDLDSDLVMSKDGEPVIKSVTLDEVLEDHDMQIEESDDGRRDPEPYDWPASQPPTEQKNLTADDLDLSDDGSEDESAAVIGAKASFGVVKRMLSRADHWLVAKCQQIWGRDPLETFEKTRARKVAFTVVFFGLLSWFGAHAAISTGLVQPETMQITPKQHHYQALVLIVAFAAYRERDP